MCAVSEMYIYISFGFSGVLFCNLTNKCLKFFKPMDLRKSTSTKKKMELTLAALAANEEKKEEKETFANSGP